MSGSVGISQFCINSLEIANWRPTSLTVIRVVGRGGGANPEVGGTTATPTTRYRRLWTRDNVRPSAKRSSPVTIQGRDGWQPSVTVEVVY